MKDQYFGNEGDYVKYGLLRSLTRRILMRDGEHPLPVGVCWLLTPPDGGTDGDRRDYLTRPGWDVFDSDLLDFLKRVRDPGAERSVDLAQEWNLIPGATYFCDVLDDDLDARNRYFERAWDALSDFPLIFFDPDIGLESPSRAKRGNKGSSQYLYWEEAKATYERGHSLVIYQHWHHKPHEELREQRAKECLDLVGAPVVYTFTAKAALMLLVPRPDHADRFKTAATNFVYSWCWNNAIEGRVHRPDSIPEEIIVVHRCHPFSAQRAHALSAADEPGDPGQRPPGMKLESGDRSFTLTILDYEFPALGPENFYANWLMIRTEVVDGPLRWSCVDPCMEVREVARLADWLDYVAGDFDPKFFAQVADPRLRRCLQSHGRSFTEPNLEFKVPKMHPKSRTPQAFLVRLSHENAPPSQLGKDAAWQKGHTIKFRLDDLDLKEAARSLRAQLAKYPQRHRPERGYNPPVNPPEPTDG